MQTTEAPSSAIEPSTQAEPQAHEASTPAPTHPSKGHEANRPALNGEGNREARLAAARAIIGKTAPSTGTQTSRPSRTAGAGDDSRGERTNTPASPASNPDGPASSDLRYGEHAAQTQDELAKLMGHGRKARLQLGPIGEKVAKGEALAASEVEQLLAHLATRDAKFQSLQNELNGLRSKTAAAGSTDGPADVAQGKSQSQRPTKPGERGQTPAGKTTQASPQAEGLDEAIYREMDQDVADNVRRAVEPLAEKARAYDESQAQLSAMREQLADLNVGRAMALALHTAPNAWKARVTEPEVQQRIWSALERFGVTEAEMAAGGPELERTVSDAITLVLSPTPAQARASQISTARAEARGAAGPPINGRGANADVAELDTHEARSRLASILESNLSREEKAAQCANVKAAHERWKGTMSARQQPPTPPRR